MLKPTKTDFYARARARRQVDDAIDDANRADQRARNSKNAAKRHQREANRLQNAINHNAKMIRAGTGGITLTGYTNTPAVEIAIYSNDLVAQAANIQPQLSDGLPFSLVSQKTIGLLKTLTVAQREDINLRLLARMEWIDWCQHVDVIARFGQISLEAFLNPTTANIAIRKKNLQQAFNNEARRYNEMREQAKSLIGYERDSSRRSQGELIRQQFEEDRYRFWKGKVRFIDAPGPNGVQRIPSTEDTQKANPGIRFDLHLPAGRLIQQFGINIADGKPAKAYHQRFAINQMDGIFKGKINSWFV